MPALLGTDAMPEEEHNSDEVLGDSEGGEVRDTWQLRKTHKIQTDILILGELRGVRNPGSRNLRTPPQAHLRQHPLLHPSYSDQSL